MWELISYRTLLHVDSGDKLDKKNWQKSPAGMFQAGPGGESNPALPCFKHDRRMYLSDNPLKLGCCECRKRKCDNSIQISRSHVWSMTMVGSRTLLSFSHVSSMTGGCTRPIYYQRVVSGEKGSVIIRFKLPELMKTVWRGTPPSRSHVSSMTMAGSRTLLSRNHVWSMTMVRRRTLLSCSHVSSMTYGCTCPIYYQGVVSVDKGSVIIRYTLAEFIKKAFLGGKPSAAMFQAWLWWGVEPCSPAAIFQAWQADVVVWYTTRESLVSKREAWSHILYF